MKLESTKINGSYQKLSIFEDITSDDLESLTLKIRDFCEKEDWCKIILDLRNANFVKISFFDQFRIGEFVAKILGPKIRIGIIQDDVLFSHFTDTVALNRGADIKVSKDENHLIHWLTEFDDVV